MHYKCSDVYYLQVMDNVIVFFFKSAKRQAEARSKYLETTEEIHM